ncbi:MAG: O-antigen ligase family protein [Acidobacteria bacterium]|nr:O-antigen ligase family protein [Acidobacteriota bacterium]
MIHPDLRLHRVLLAIVLVANAVAFAGVDPATRAATALAALVLALDLRQLPEVPAPHRYAAVALAVLVLVQLIPWPAAVHRFLQPGLAAFLPQGLWPLTAAPWATLRAAGALAVAGVLALTAARMAATRSGLPALLILLTATGALLGLLGLATEPGLPGKVLLIRDNTGGGGPYGPFVNRNHFAVAIELTLPAALALLAAAARHLKIPGESRRGAAVTILATAATAAVGIAALLRSGSRGGALFLAAGAVLTLPLWSRRRRHQPWIWATSAVLVVGVAATALAWNRLPELQDRFMELVSLEGAGGNTRLDLWAGTLRLWRRSPAVGAGLGAYRYAIDLDKPPTGALELRHAHNDWLEWTADTGVAGAVLLLTFGAGLVWLLAPGKVRRMRFEHRYALAAAAFALCATALHEMVGFGLQTPLNAQLAAVWTGLIWGVAGSPRPGRGGESPAAGRGPADSPSGGEA